MANQNTTKQQDLEALRVSFIRSELMRIKLASFAMSAIGLLCLLFLAFVARAAYPRIEWQLIAMLGFAGFCVAFPLFRKFDLSREGSGFETRDPLELIEKMQVQTVEARSESFEQLRCQIGALSDQLSEVSNQLADLVESGAPPALKSTKAGQSGLVAKDKEEISLRQIRESLPPVKVTDDPQKGRFGGDYTSNGRILTAKVEPSAMGEKWMKVTLTVGVTNDRPLEGAYAYLFLHDTYQPDEYKVRVDAKGMTASLEVLAWGAFTVGAVVDRGKTTLELDLATSPSVQAPDDWRGR